MKRKNKNGFTLIELLAVIVILAIIALIAVPVVMNIITKARKSAFKDTAYGIIKAGELYYADRLLEPEGMTEDKVFTFPNNITGLEINGNKPSSGSVIVTKEGKVAIGVTDGKYCATKGYDDSDLKIADNVETCGIPNPYISSDKACVTQGKCTEEEILSGIKVNVQVNATENYGFYVINDTGDELTLLMDRNIGEDIAWITESDYEIKKEKDETSCGHAACGDFGPLTLIGELEERTRNWDNVPLRTYTYKDDSTGNNYNSSETDVDLTNLSVRTRLLTYTEANYLGCAATDGSCSTWVYRDGTFWLSSAPGGAHEWGAHSINANGAIVCLWSIASRVDGVRPVITLTKRI